MSGSRAAACTARVHATILYSLRRRLDEPSRRSGPPSGLPTLCRGTPSGLGPAPPAIRGDARPPLVTHSQQLLFRVEQRRAGRSTLPTLTSSRRSSREGLVVVGRGAQIGIAASRHTNLQGSRESWSRSAARPLPSDAPANRKSCPRDRRAATEHSIRPGSMSPRRT